MTAVDGPSSCTEYNVTGANASNIVSPARIPMQRQYPCTASSCIRIVSGSFIEDKPELTRVCTFVLQ